MNLFDILSIPVGMLASAGEWIYSRKYDTGLNLANAINRRAIKLSAMLNFIFSIVDFATQNNDKYTISDDVLALLSGSLMFAAIYELRQASLRAPALTVDVEVPNSQQLQVALMR